jgi:hypothetical protein
LQLEISPKLPFKGLCGGVFNGRGGVKTPTAEQRSPPRGVLSPSRGVLTLPKLQKGPAEGVLSARGGLFTGKKNLKSGLASKKRTVKSSHLVNCFWFRSQLGTGN